jgi:hypothetical protein
VEAQTQSSPTWSLQSLKEKTLSNKKLPYILAAVGLLFFLLMFISSLTGKKQNENLALKSEVTDTAKKLAPVTETINTKKPANILPEQTQAPVHEVNTPVEKETVVPARKKKKKIEEENIIENKTPEAPVVKQEERKEVYINSRVEVKLQLQGQFEDGDREKDRPVSFVVSSPVVYNGVTIIRQGAVAKGDISLGRVITAIHIYSVTGANGQQLSFQSANFHRKRRDIDSDKSYEAVLEEGIRMSF